MNKERWGIYYTDERDGCRKLYMRSAFESQKSAKMELQRIKKVRNKLSTGLFPFNLGNSEIPPLSVRVGKNFRIKKIK